MEYFKRNLGYLISSNVVNLIIGLLMIIVVPKILSIEQFGYWQLYLLYISIVGFLHFGFIDGLYIFFGGKNFSDLIKSNLRTYISIFLILQLLISLLIMISLNFTDIDENRYFILKMFVISITIINFKTLFLLILQATEQFKKVAIITYLEKICTLILIILIIVLQSSISYQFLIIGDLTIKVIALMYSSYYFKDILLIKKSSNNSLVSEIKTIYTTGFILMTSNLANILIFFTFRFVIENNWEIEVFSSISLSVSIILFITLLLNSFGLLIFPKLKRISFSSALGRLNNFENITNLILPILLLLYYPIVIAIEFWLPQYIFGLKYLMLLFPLILIEGRNVIYLNQYYKAYNLQKCLMMINYSILSLLLISLILSINYNLPIYVMCIFLVLNLMIRNFLMEYHIDKFSIDKSKKNKIMELIIITIFYLINVFVVNYIAFVLFSFLLILNVILNRKKLKHSFKEFKENFILYK